MDKLVRTLSKNPKCYLLHRMTFILLIALIMAFFGYCYMNPRKQRVEIIQAGASITVRKCHDLQGVELPRMVLAQPDVLTPSRKDVLVMTPWLAPIMWEGTFNIDILNEQFHLQNTTIGLTVFAIKSYIVFLKLFLETAEMYFMVGHRVNYYIFTDRPDYVPYLHLQKGRQIIVLKVQSYARREDISMHRMEMISNFSKQRFHWEVDYLVCSDVDLKFSDHVGVEILSSLFGTLHLDFFFLSRKNFPYERRPHSQAHIPEDEGDFYYTGALFGGSVMEVYRLTKTCHQAMMIDQVNHIEAVWHDESHLNKYLLHHKPSKVLSPEYMWSKQLWDYSMRHQMGDLPSSIKRFRVNILKKNQRRSN